MSVTIDLVAATLIPEFELDELEGFFLLRWKNPPPFTDDELLEMFALNEGLQFEVDCDGSLIIMSPSGLKSGFRTMQLTTQLGVWANRDGTGVASTLPTGVRLGWLLDPPNRTAYVYRPGVAVQVFENAESLDASPELPGFVLDLAPIWA